LTISDHVAVDLKQARAWNQSNSGTSRPSSWIAVDQKPSGVDARVPHRPDLPVDNGGDSIFNGQQVAEPEVTVHDCGRQGRRCTDPQGVGDITPSRRQRGIDGFQGVAPPLDLRERSDYRLGLETDGARLDAV
jgi:hypothetical protein